MKNGMLHMLRKTTAYILLIAMMVSIAACGSTETASDAETTEEAAAETDAAEETETEAAAEPENTDPINVVWYPNESSNTHEDIRAEFGKLITQATGREVEQKLTTDYTIAIEALASGSADLAMAMGAVGYIEAKNKNPEVDVLFVNADAEGTLDGAKYFSWLCVPADQADTYKNGDEYAIDNIKGKKMSFVSNSSTSGFMVPTTSIIEYFAADKLDQDALVTGGSDMFFSEVVFGGSHQGSAANLIDGKVDVAAFCDTELQAYVELKSGEENTVGATYAVKEGADAPFDQYAGKEFTLISVSPVFNGPCAYNPKNLSDSELQAIKDLFLSDEVANNETIFYDDEDPDAFGLYAKADSKGFIETEDSWYDAYRK